MDAVATWSAGDRRVLFIETASRMGVASPVIPEKDFWVCFTLHHLFQLDFRPRLLFKGGTSLSKAFGIIERFSEDIDLTLNRADLGFEGARDPACISGRKSRRRQIEALAAACGEVVRHRLQPALRGLFKTTLVSDEWALKTVPRSDGQVDLHFQYPPSLFPEEYGALSYIEPSIRLEIGARSDQEPSENVRVESYAAEHFPNLFVRRDTNVRVLSPERTFWEKATIFHAENHRPPSGGSALPPAWKQLSRHAYDILRMERCGIADRALARPELLVAVARHKQTFFYSGWARYLEAAPGSFRLVPGEDLSLALRHDYDEMASMIFGERPDFEELLGVLRDLETRINRIR